MVTETSRVKNHEKYYLPIELLVKEEFGMSPMWSKQQLNMTKFCNMSLRSTENLKCANLLITEFIV